MSPQQKIAVSFTKRLLLVMFFSGASIFLIRGIYALGMAQPQESSSQERKFKITEFKDMPVRVQKVKNLQSETWNKDLEIEVKNVSSKPVYFILAYLIFPDDKTAAGEVGFPLTFGKRENILIRRIAEAEDPHLNPDEIYVFTIPEPHRRGFEGRHKKFPAAYRNFRLDVMLVSFGDGTGWEVGEPRDKRKQLHVLQLGEKNQKDSNHVDEVNKILALSVEVVGLRNS